MEVKVFKFKNCRLDEIVTSPDGAAHTLEIMDDKDIIHLEFASTEARYAAQSLAVLDAAIESAKDSAKSKLSLLPVKAVQLEEIALHENDVCLRIISPSGLSFRFLIPLKSIPLLQQEFRKYLDRVGSRAPLKKQ